MGVLGVGRKTFKHHPPVKRSAFLLRIHVPIFQLCAAAAATSVSCRSCSSRWPSLPSSFPFPQRSRDSFNMERMVVHTVKAVKRWGDPADVLSSASPDGFGCSDQLDDYDDDDIATAGAGTGMASGQVKTLGGLSRL